MNLSFITEGLLFHLHHLQEGLSFLNRTVKPSVGASDLKQTKHKQITKQTQIFRDRRLTDSMSFFSTICKLWRVHFWF